MAHTIPTAASISIAPLNTLHTRLRSSTLEVAELAHVKASGRVLDVGCGRGGTARHLTSKWQGANELRLINENIVCATNEHKNVPT